jgi:hypothetical protein
LIKEFIKNAGDGKATELTVVLDRRSHPQGPVRDPRMKRLLGSSLLITNDAKFTDEDHLGITMLLSIPQSARRRVSWGASPNNS